MNRLTVDPIALTRELVRLPSVTPEAQGPIAHLEALLAAHGFETYRIDRGDVPNLFARFGPKDAARRFGFNGHVDVVPVGDADAWRFDPFGGAEDQGWLYGRGAIDMKSGVAAYVSAAIEWTKSAPEDSAVIVTVTGDEEGPSTDGTIAILDWMAEQGEAMQGCIVAEPSSANAFGDTIKIGRRGSLNARFTAQGMQGHAAYPHLAVNPLPALTTLAAKLAAHQMDQGSEAFDPSTLTLTSIDTGNEATNVIPARADMRLNIRFNDHHSGASVSEWLRKEAAQASTDEVQIDVTCQISGESFVTEPGALTDALRAAVRSETGLEPAFSTGGGTSDARFVRAFCPVVEFGLVGHRMHAVDERVWIDDIPRLARIFHAVLREALG